MLSLCLVVAVVTVPIGAVLIAESRLWTRKARHKALQDRINALGRGF